MNQKERSREEWKLDYAKHIKYICNMKGRIIIDLSS
jgi:hypothetical protein